MNLLHASVPILAQPEPPEPMIMHNTIMGEAAGMALIGIALFLWQARRGRRIWAKGWALTFGVGAVILTSLSWDTLTTGPFTAKPVINMVFGGPLFWFGILLGAAAVYLWTHADTLQEPLEGATEDAASYRFAGATIGTLLPVSLPILATGLNLLGNAVAIIRFNLVGGAPPNEPITGRLGHMEWMENGTFGLIYGVAAVATLLLVWAVRDLRGRIAAAVIVMYAGTGLFFLVFSALNEYTHPGLMVNTCVQGTMENCQEWKYNY
ncbi:hypothetical protein GCM10023085_18710 [Actinomadura viridis]|uniref:Uncharacterized protein n=1 Tax=Actinomadura viridis TaxID=58110 RepID=A0A931GJN4_9ACTN|nr:DUF981 family protein [Actinomadura viridis]MBG6089372.1 hypothetical protein [Actinomadura viridis]